MQHKFNINTSVLCIESIVDAQTHGLSSLPQRNILSFLDLCYSMPAAINNIDTRISDFTFVFILPLEYTYGNILRCTGILRLAFGILAFGVLSYSICVHSNSKHNR